jgi:hypothetical protein
MTTHTTILDALLTRARSNGDDRALLRMIRDETSYLVVLVRVANDERQAEARATMVAPVQEGF